jgi:hypothetical protein
MTTDTDDHTPHSTSTDRGETPLHLPAIDDYTGDVAPVDEAVTDTD